MQGKDYRIWTLKGWLNENVADGGVGYIPRKGLLAVGLCVVAFYAVAIIRLDNRSPSPTPHGQSKADTLKPGVK